MLNTKKIYFLEFDTWFEENIDPKDLENYVDENVFRIIYMKNFIIYNVMN